MGTDVDRANALREKGDGELMSLYIKLRDRIDAEAKAFKQEAAKRVALLTQIEGVLLERLQERGTTNTASQDAVAFIEESTFCGVSDWDALLDYIMSEEQIQFLNHAVNKSAVAEYMRENDGDLPPGVKWTVEKSLKIRRK